MLFNILCGRGTQGVVHVLKHFIASKSNGFNHENYFTSYLLPWSSNLARFSFPLFNVSEHFLSLWPLRTTDPMATSDTILVQKSSVCRQMWFPQNPDFPQETSLCGVLCRGPGFQPSNQVGVEVLQVPSQDQPGGSALAPGASPRNLPPQKNAYLSPTLQTICHRCFQNNDYFHFDFVHVC